MYILNRNIKINYLTNFFKPKLKHMKKFNFHSIVEAKNVMKALSFVAFLAFVMVTSSIDASAQSAQSNGILPQTHTASKFASQLGVTVAPLGSWDINKVIPVLNQRLNALDKNSTDPVVRFKVAYFSKVLSDVSKYDVSPELSTLQTMSEVSEKFNNPAITVVVMKALYTTTTSTF